MFLVTLNDFRCINLAQYLKKKLWILHFLILISKINMLRIEEFLQNGVKKNIDYNILGKVMFFWDFFFEYDRTENISDTIIHIISRSFLNFSSVVHHCRHSIWNWATAVIKISQTSAEKISILLENLDFRVKQTDSMPIDKYYATWT